MATEQAPSESVALAEAYLEWVKPLIKDPGMQKMEAMARAVIAADRALVASQAQPAAEPVPNVSFDHLWILVQTIAQEEAAIRHPHTSSAGVDGAKRRRDKAQAELRVDLHELLAAQQPAEPRQDSVHSVESSSPS